MDIFLDKRMCSSHYQILKSAGPYQNRSRAFNMYSVDVRFSSAVFYPKDVHSCTALLADVGTSTDFFKAFSLVATGQVWVLSTGDLNHSVAVRCLNLRY